ncbi:MAG TPA: MCE family protein [Mycobacterium sp.]|nr:MCE family protein [Mycobacterium sp.]
MRTTRVRLALAIVLALALVGGIVVSVRFAQQAERTYVTAYFDNSNGIFVGDDVVVLGVPVGRIDKIEPEPTRAKITFWIADGNDVPADAKAVILSPQLVTAREIQLTPAYTAGPKMRDGAVIPQDRTAVPMEWDDVRQQLEKLSTSLQPTEPGGVSPLGTFINTTADNLRGQGASIRQAIIQLAQAISTLGDHSGDIFTTVKHLSILVSALHSSTDALKMLNQNLAGVTALLANDPNEVAQAIADVNTAAGDVASFVADNREAVGTTSDKLASISQTLVGSLDDIKQALHVAPTAAQNLMNIYDPAHGAITGVLAVNNFANPLSFLCGAIQAASRLGGEQAAKLCVQYLAPIVKNRQFNFPPIGINPFVTAQARPNEVTYSEDWMRPDYQPTPPPAQNPDPAPPLSPPPPDGLLPAEAAATPPGAPTDPATGLQGMMLSAGGGS